MAGSVDVIREFLVSVGFKVDESSEKKFVDAMVSGTLKAAAFGVAVEAAAAAVVAGVTKIASQMESLYFASQRTNASVEKIQALRFAAEQLGGTADGAQNSLESLARFMRNSPGAEGLIKSIGVQTREINGELRDTSAIMGDLGKQFANMPYYRANAYAQALGIDERTLMAMRQGMGQVGDEYREMLKAAGMDSQEAAKNSHAFMNEVRSLGSAFVILEQKVASTLAGGMSSDLRRFREGFVSNFSQIAGIITSVAKGVLWLADVMSSLVFRAMQLAGDVVDWFNSWDDGAKKAAAALAALLVAWKLLNSGILATPLGIVVALGAAILALYDDYKVWKEGGKSLIDWGTWLPDIDLAKKLLRELGDAFTELGEIINAAMAHRWGDLATHATKFMSIVNDAGEKTAKVLNDVQAKANQAGSDVATNVASEGNGAVSQTGMGNSRSLDFASGPSSADSKPAASGSSRGIAASAFGALIAKGEGDYDSVNRGAKHGYQSGKENLEQMTVAQVMAAQKDGKFNAAGRYQLIGTTLADAVKSMGLKGNEKFDRGIQDRIFEQYLVNNKRRAIGDYISGKSNDLVAAMKAASREWASVADPSTGRSHYAGVGNNRASISTEAMSRALQAARASAGGNPYAVQQLADASTNAAAGTQSGARTVINQTNHTTVNGASDPRAVGQSVANAQEGVNQRLIRNMRSATA
ncbi:glycoside hydrolase family 104 protein [Paraburkholderia dioscoreae]|uniref:Putative bacteriophage protein n=1 Tax=Paraburkholderia dioscoreae TaxID=2604047 RepID=A0A5Q4ZMI5_9BURK|nr:glycoside hydrolase family 104 protein [Paraburkholderia dioscoreae]VVD29156.1 putative bacteriophage protein [Paraburkholderia dioscoreae]